MVELGHGNLLESDAEALVNTVNCVGVMGKGVALQFRQAFPDNYEAYRRACERGQVVPGRMFTWATEQFENPKYVINFPTKRHWKGKSKLADIEAGLAALAAEVKRLGIRSIAVPPLGCGSGGLAWRDVRPRIEAALAGLLDVRVILFEPSGAPEPERMRVATEQPHLTRARAMFILLLERYAEPGYRLTLLEIQKLAYFLQTAGEPLRLAFVKHKYGPYADNLNHLLQRLEGHYFRGYGDRSREASIHLLPGAAEAAKSFLAAENGGEAERRLERVSTLIDGFETPYGMELLATVHWVASEDTGAAPDIASVTERVQGWSQRKRQTFRPEHIRRAWSRLDKLSWLPTVSQ